MRCDSSVLLRWYQVILASAVITSCLPALAYCQTDGVALLLQQTPAQGGMVTPEAGIHNFQLHTDVALTAIPRPGYQFVYWLGDVSEPTANRTNVYLDAPKIIIAVFERAEYEYIDTEQEIQRSRGLGGLRASAADYSNTGYTGGGGRRVDQQDIPEQRKFKQEEIPPQEEEDVDDFPVPEEGEQDYDFPVPIPEPATALLLMVGSLLTLTNRRRGKRL